jgi:hypothetical protein
MMAGLVRLLPPPTDPQSPIRLQPIPPTTVARRDGVKVAHAIMKLCCEALQSTNLPALNGAPTRLRFVVHMNILLSY